MARQKLINVVILRTEAHRFGEVCSVSVKPFRTQVLQLQEAAHYNVLLSLILLSFFYESWNFLLNSRWKFLLITASQKTKN